MASPARGNVVLTGATGGIGRETCLVLAREGYDLLLIDKDVDSLESLSIELRESFSVAAKTITCNFAEDVSLRECVSQIRPMTNSIVGLVNVAGIALDAPFHMTSTESIELSYRINFLSAVKLTQRVTRIMAKTGGGSVVNVSSITAQDGNEGQLAYGASKAAVINFTKTASIELGSSGIRVNAVCPGIIATNMTLSLPQTQLAKLASRPFLGRLGQPSEVAQVILFLLSEKSSYITGQSIRVDGCV